MDKIKREAQEEKAQRTSAFSTPTHQLANRASAVRQAPKGLVENHKRPPPPREAGDHGAPRPATMFAPRKGSFPKSGGVAPPQDAALVSREQRLKALTVPGTKPVPAPAEERASLPAGAVFNVPRLKRAVSPIPKVPEKRKKVPDVFMPSKKRA